MNINLAGLQDDIDGHLAILRRAYPDHTIHPHVACVPPEDSPMPGVYQVWVPFVDHTNGWEGWMHITPDGARIDVDELPSVEHMR